MRRRVIYMQVGTREHAKAETFLSPLVGTHIQYYSHIYIPRY